MQQTILFVLLAVAGGGVAAWQMRGWYDARQADVRGRKLDEIAEDLSDLEAMRDDNSALDAKRVRDVANAEKQKVLAERFAKLQ
jgi:hypothetical protein